MTKVNIYKVDGKTKEKTDLPKIFNTPYRPDIIRKAFHVLRSNKRQPYGADKRAGAKHATASIGKGQGMSRVPRLTQGRTAALAPCVVGGRRAHPPKTEKNWKEKINKKEKELAKKSAISATSNKELVKERGHLFEDKITLPIIIEEEFEKIKKTKEVVNTFKNIGIYKDVRRSSEGKHVRAGKGKQRNRRYKKPKSVLVVTDKENLIKSCRNIPGVDVVKTKEINIEHLAPGGNGGRLTVFTESSFKKIKGGK